MNSNHHNYTVALDIPQPSFLIEHPVGNDVVPQRPQDGYINATRLCKQAGKQLNDYGRLAHTKSFLEELSLETGIPVSNLVQVIRGRGDRVEQGTWVHPQVAVNLGQWLSPSFAVQVTKWVFDWMSGKAHPWMPVHVQRYLKNSRKVPYGYFSMLNEIYLNLLAPLEEYGVVLPDRMMPDISTGQMFSGFLRSKGIATGEFPSYDHEFVDSKRPTVQARLYPIEHLADFKRYFNEVWLPDRAPNYFAEREPKVLPYLSKIEALPSPETE